LISYEELPSRNSEEAQYPSFSRYKSRGRVNFVFCTANRFQFNARSVAIPFNTLRFGKFLARDKPCWLGSISTRLPLKNVLNISLDVNDPILCRPSKAKREPVYFLESPSHVVLILNISYNTLLFPFMSFLLLWQAFKSN